MVEQSSAQNYFTATSTDNESIGDNLALVTAKMYLKDFLHILKST